MKHCPQCGRTYPDKQRFCLDDGALLSLRDPYHLVGRTLAAKYRLDALVGVGGMGAVYSAYHLALDRRVAFKILQPNLTLGNERTLDLFEREARMAGRLVHENIVLVLDAGRTADDIAYIAMEWLDGHTLEGELATSGPLNRNSKDWYKPRRNEEHEGWFGADLFWFSSCSSCLRGLYICTNIFRSF